jgi:HlyD family secretion protein
VAPEVNRTSRLGRVRVALDGAPGLTIGTFGRGRVEVARRTGIAVPTSAVLFAVDGARVQVVKDGVVETRAVTVGLKSGREVEIVRGGAAGEAVVAVSGTFLRPGDAVRAIASAQ